MAHRYWLEILAVISILAFCTLFLYTSSLMKTAKFEGSDTLGSEKISEMTGVPADEIQPLIPQWVPPGKEIESALFALQAAIGGILVGGVFGYWLGLKKGSGNI